MNKIVIEEYLNKYIELISRVEYVKEAYGDLNKFITDPDKFVTDAINSGLIYKEYVGITNAEISKDMQNLKLGLNGEFTRNQAIKKGRNKLFSILNIILNHISNTYSSVKDNIVGPLLINKDNFAIVVSENMYVNNFLDRKNNYMSSDVYKEYFLNGLITIMQEEESFKIKDPLTFLLMVESQLDNILKDINNTIAVAPDKIKNFLNFYLDQQKLIPATLADKDVNKTYKRYEEPKYEDLSFTNVVSGVITERPDDFLDGKDIISTLDKIYEHMLTYLNKTIELNKIVTDTLLAFPSKTYDIELIIDSLRNMVRDLKDDNVTKEEAEAMFIKHEYTLLNTITLDQHLLVLGLEFGNIINHHLNNYVNIYNAINKITAKAVLVPKDNNLTTSPDQVTGE